MRRVEDFDCLHHFYIIYVLDSPDMTLTTSKKLLLPQKNFYYLTKKMYEYIDHQEIDLFFTSFTYCDVHESSQSPRPGAI